MLCCPILGGRIGQLFEMCVHAYDAKVYLHTHTHIYKQIHIYTYTQIQIYMYIHIHIYIIVWHKANTFIENLLIIFQVRLFLKSHPEELIIFFPFQCLQVKHEPKYGYFQGNSNANPSTFLHLSYVSFVLLTTVFMYIQ